MSGIVTPSAGGGSLFLSSPRPATIHPSADVHPGTRFEGTNEIGRSTVKVGCSFGLGSYIGDYAFVGQHTDIGRYCSIANNTTIGAHPHPMEWFSTSPTLAPGELWVAVAGRTSLGHDVWVGANAVVLAGARIGTGAVIAAGAVVLGDVPPYAIVVGVPAKIKRFRFDEYVIARLLASEWWDLPLGVLQSLPTDDVEASLMAIGAAVADA